MAHQPFYSTAAQVIPVLLVLGVIESRLPGRQALLSQVREVGRNLIGAPALAPEGLAAWAALEILLFILTTPLMWVLVLLAGEVAAFLALWLGDSMVLAIIPGVAVGYGLLLVIAGAAVQLVPVERSQDEDDDDDDE